MRRTSRLRPLTSKRFLLKPVQQVLHRRPSPRHNLRPRRDAHTGHFQSHRATATHGEVGLAQQPATENRDEPFATPAEADVRVVGANDEQVARLKLEFLGAEPVVRCAAGDVAKFPVLVRVRVKLADSAQRPRISNHRHGGIRKQDRRPLKPIELDGAQWHRR